MYVEMQIVKEKQYEWVKERQNLIRISYTSNGTLCLIMSDGTHYNFCGDELKMILKFLEKLK